MSRWAWTWACLPLAMGAMSWPAGAQEEAAPEFLQIAFIESAFQTVNKADAIAAVTVWAEQLLKNRNMPMKSRVNLFATVKETAEAIDKGEVDVVALSASDYLTVSAKTQLDPIFLANKRGNPNDQYQLLVHRQARLENLSELRDKDILLHCGGHMLLGREWFASVCAAEGIGPVPVTFTQTDKVLSALLPVFMRQKPACLVSRTTFENAVEMNPQLGRDLVVLRSSELMATAVLSLRRSYPYRRAEVIDELGKLHQSPRGQQILMLLKYERLVPFEDAALNSTRSLMQEAAALTNAPVARTP